MPHAEAAAPARPLDEGDVPRVVDAVLVRAPAALPDARSEPTRDPQRRQAPVLHGEFRRLGVWRARSRRKERGRGSRAEAGPIGRSEPGDKAASDERGRGVDHSGLTRRGAERLVGEASGRARSAPSTSGFPGSSGPAGMSATGPTGARRPAKGKGMATMTGTGRDAGATTTGLTRSQVEALIRDALAQGGRNGAGQSENGSSLGSSAGDGGTGASGSGTANSLRLSPSQIRSIVQQEHRKLTAAQAVAPAGLEPNGGSAAGASGTSQASSGQGQASPPRTIKRGRVAGATRTGGGNGAAGGGAGASGAATGGSSSGPGSTAAAPSSNRPVTLAEIKALIQQQLSSLQSTPATSRGTGSAMGAGSVRGTAWTGSGGSGGGSGSTGGSGASAGGSSDNARDGQALIQRTLADGNANQGSRNASPAAGAGSGSGFGVPWGPTHAQTVASVLTNAQWQLSQELEGNLKQLRQVIQQSQEVARKIEQVLGYGSGSQSRS